MIHAASLIGHGTVSCQQVITNTKWYNDGVFCFIALFIFGYGFFIQVSAIEQDIIEVDPDTKEMLKVLVSDCLDTASFL